MSKTSYTPDSIKAQAAEILSRWGMSADNVALTAEGMLDCDLRGIDTHGISLLALYDKWRVGGGFSLDATDKRLRDGPSYASIDAQGGLGFPVSVRAVELACEKARDTGLSAVTVKNSRHFGAAGYYARLGAEQGMMMLVATSTKVVCMVPPGAADAVLGTNPLAYAVPRQNGAPVVFDMATSTAAGNKIRLYQLSGTPVPEGWVVDHEGKSVTDPDIASEIVYGSRPGGLTPLGATPGMGAYKGYGLALMGHFFGGTLAGGDFAGSQNRAADAPDNIGHFFLAMDPSKFRDLAEFEADMCDVDNSLRATPAVDPDRPILLPGDVERKVADQRRAAGIPLADALVDQLRRISTEAGAKFVLTPQPE